MAIPIKVSVITPVYNRVETIADAVRSVQQQTYKNIEHLVIDGGSTDGTVDTLKKMGYGVGDMKLISEPDDGIYDAINKGMRFSTGDIIGLMHSDDFYADNMVLEGVVSAFADECVDVVYGDLMYVSNIDPKKVIRYWRAGEYSYEKLLNGWMPPHPTLYLRRRVVERCGEYDTRYRIAGDYDYILRCFKNGGVCPVYIPRVFVMMRVGGESNRTIDRIIIKSIEDYFALRQNAVGGASTLLLKNMTKVHQYFMKTLRRSAVIQKIKKDMLSVRKLF